MASSAYRRTSTIVKPAHQGGQRGEMGVCEHQVTGEVCGNEREGLIPKEAEEQEMKKDVGRVTSGRR